MSSCVCGMLTVNMDLWTPTVVDGGAERRPLYVGAGRLWSRAERERITPRVFMEIRDEMEGKSGPMMLSVSVALLWAGIFLWRQLGAAAILIIVPAVLGLGFLDLFLARMTLRDCRTGAIFKALAALHRCPSCAAQLRLEVAEDGCHACSECSAAWRIGTSEPLRCRRCEYALTGLAKEKCGCVRCPECGQPTPTGPGGCPLGQWRPRPMPGCESRV